MADTKIIKRRIKSVRNIGQITKALQMVSAVKMRKAQTALADAAGYYEYMQDMFENLVAQQSPEQMITLAHEQKHIALVMIAPSKGFAGALLSNLTRKTYEFIQNRESHKKITSDEFLIFHEEEQGLDESNVDIKLITVEKKSHDLAIHVRKNVIADFPKLSNPPQFTDIIPITNILVDGYQNQQLDEVYIVYTHFVNTFTQKAVVKKLLPLSIRESKKAAIKKLPYTYATSSEQLFARFFGAYIETLVFHSVLDAIAAEHSARMIAMQNATDNANDLKRELVFEYNQKRQASITQELAEITSAAETI